MYYPARTTLIQRPLRPNTRSTRPRSWTAGSRSSSSAAASPCSAGGARDAVGREDALQLLAALGDVHGRLDDLKRWLRELVDEGQGAP